MGNDRLLSTSGDGFWTPELKKVRAQLRREKKRDMRGAERKRLAKVLSAMIAARLRQVAARRVLWWSHCMRSDARLAWRTIRTDALNRRAGTKKQEVSEKDRRKKEEATALLEKRKKY